MKSRRVVFCANRILVACAAIVASTAAWASNPAKIIYSFSGGSDGGYADTELVRDSAGNLYGTSVQGGTYNSGTVFQVSPAGVHTVLYSFKGGRDGGEPYKGVTLGPDGSLYGTAVAGGGGHCDSGCGVVFKLTNTGGTWTQTVIHKFSGVIDGAGPGSPVAFGQNGYIYGTTPTGGAYGMGTVYQIKPQGDGWRLLVIHAFTGGADGTGGSAGRLLVDGAGNLFGVCTSGGVNGFGTVYEMSHRPGHWTFTTLYAFKDSPDGGLPYGGLVLDQAGNLYGTTYYAGANEQGTVFQLTPGSSGWNESVLYSFQSGRDGANPISGLVMDAAGNLYGTTSAGGALCGCGVIFRMHHASNGQWRESVLYRFPGSPRAGNAYNGMIVDSSGNFWGTTVNGGSGGDGAIYEFTP